MCKDKNIISYSVTNYFVVNLSIADLLVTTICMPMTISQEISMSWNHSEFLCKLTSYLQSKYFYKNIQ